MKNTSRFLCLLLLALFASPVLARQSGERIVRIDHQDVDPARSVDVILPDGAVRTYERQPDTALRVIVAFTDEPLFLARLHKAAASPASYQARFAQFAADLGAIDASRARVAGKSAEPPTIERTFYKVFTGAVVEAPPGVLTGIRALPYVRGVYLDREVKATLNESVHLIRADTLRNRFQVDGTGVTVAIIDTGVDYLHPALGGGFGPGFKVAGGYDFINDDDDPMDDNGHGTHVAGIIAADDENVTGVAPGATLLAYKVLDAGGIGYSDEIIAALEMAADPDGDGDTADHADVANMSLGSHGGKPDDPLAEAVTNASMLGIAVCVAAGNEGTSGFQTIGSPGSSPEAITVGASDKDDVIAPFSSRGPNRVSLSIKPDVVAPGVDITSTFLSDDYETFSGTSMATPHVAGTAALLKAVHPAWSSSEIKTALMNAAVDVGEEAMIQGSGRIDALAAAELPVLATPASLSFGLADVSVDEWPAQQTLHLVNHGEAAATFSTAITGLAAGITLTADPATFTLAPGEAVDVVVDLTVDNAAVPFPSEGSLAYTGALLFESDAATLRLPWAFVKATVVTVTSDTPDPFYLMTNVPHGGSFVQTPFGVTDPDDPFVSTFLAPKGTYDLAAVIGDAETVLLFKKNLDIAGSVSIALRLTDAPHTVTFNSVDENGRPLAETGSLLPQDATLFFLPPDDGGIIGATMRLKTVDGHFSSSDIPDGFALHLTEFQDDVVDNNTVRVVSHAIDDGLTGDLTLQNVPEALVGRRVTVRAPSSVTAPTVRLSPTEKFTVTGTNVIVFFSMRGPEKPMVGGTWEGKIFINAQASNPFVTTARLEVVDADRRFPNIVLSGAPFFITDGQVGTFFRLTPSVYVSPPDGILSFGTGPVFPDAFHFNNRLGTSNVAIGHRSYKMGFFGTLGEVRQTEGERARYALENAGGEVVSAGAFGDFLSADVAPDAYRLTIEDGAYHVAGGQGVARLTTAFDLRKDDPDPPRLTAFRLLDADGMATATFSQGDEVSLFFAAGDYLNELNGDGTIRFSYESVDGASAFYRAHGVDTWTEVPVTAGGESADGGLVFTADLTDATEVDDAAVDVRIETRDTSGNTTTWTLGPAFTVGDFHFPVDVEDDAASDALPRRYALEANYPNPFNPETVIPFDLPVAGKVRLVVYDLLGREVARLVDGRLAAGKHSAHFDGSGLASGLYLYRLDAGTYSRTRRMLLVK